MSREKQISAKQGFKWWATQESIPGWWWSIVEVPRTQPHVKGFLKHKNAQRLHNSSSNIHVRRKNKHYQSSGLDWWWPNVIMKSIVEAPRGSQPYMKFYLLKTKNKKLKRKNGFFKIFLIKLIDSCMKKEAYTEIAANGEN